MIPIGVKPPRVAVEYDCRGERRSKTFECPYEARQFFCAKDKAGCNPKVRRAEDARTHQP